MAERSAVWIVNHYATHPLDEIGGARHQSLGRELGRRQWDVTILAATTGHPSGRQRPAESLQSSVAEGVSWLWVRSPGYHRHPVLRVLNMAAFALGVVRRGTTAGRPRPDVVVGSTVHPLAAWAARRLARRHRVPFVFEIRDLWPETLIHMGALKRGSATAWLLRSLERHLCRQAQLIVVTMPGAGRYLRTLGVDEAKVLWISNGADLTDDDGEPLPERPGFEFLYFGAHGQANDITAIVDGFEQLLQQADGEELQLTLIGDGPLKGTLQRDVARRGLGKVIRFEDPIPRSRLMARARAADALVMSVPPLGLYQYGISPNKLFDYLAAGRPVIFTGDPLNNPVRDADAGAWRTSNSPSAVAEAMGEIYRSHPDQRLAWGANGIRHVQEAYSYPALAVRLDEALRRLPG